MKIGIFGLGRQGERHVRIMKQLGQDIFVFDINHERMLEIATKYGANIFTSDCILDGAIIATNTNTHYEVAKPLLENGVSLLIEKPMTLKSEEAKILLEIAEKKGLILSTGMTFRFTSGYNDFKKIVNALDIKKIIFRFYNMTPPRKDSNILFNLGIHFIDMLFGVGPFEDNKHKLNIQIEYSDIKGSIFIESNNILIEIHLMYNAKQKIRDINISTGSSRIYIDLKKNIGAEPLLLEDKHFLECIQNKKVPINKANYYLIKLLEEFSKNENKKGD